MSSGNSPPLISTPGPSNKGRQAIHKPTPATRTSLTGLGLDSQPGPSVAAQGSPRIGPREGNLPSLTDPSGPSRPRKKARSESDRGSSSDKDKRPRLGPSSRSEGEESATTSTDHSSTESVTPSTSRSSSPSGSPIPANKPIPKPRAPARTGTALRQLRSPPRSPSPTLSPIPVDSTRGAPALSGTAGNLDSTRYMDLESTRPQHIPLPTNPKPSTSYAAMAARPGIPTTQRTSQSPKAPPPRSKGRAQEVLRRHPPIMVEALPNWPRHLAAIRERLGRAPSARPFGAVEGWRPTRGPAQCHRCQAFGHASYNCHRAVRCVRCAGEHIVADCPRPRDGPFSCANCGKDHVAVDRRCAVFRKRARMMGVTVPPPAPPVPRAGGAAPPAVLPIVRGKGKGKGKSSLPPAPPPRNSIPSAVVVEAEPSATTLMAQANRPRRTNKPIPVPRGRTSAGVTPTPRPTGGPAPGKNSNRNKKKKQKKKDKKKEAREREEAIRATDAAPLEQSQMVVETMEVNEASPTAQTSNSNPPLPSAHLAEDNSNLNSQPGLKALMVPEQGHRVGRDMLQLKADYDQ
ncbi:serine/arginine repetitive matrix protein 1-like [Bombyx mori]|uniref:serine/arginine repetitive matrix protein 1-like n=1 Tax=Bombyx mori TaxID=7091 RepID=UPI002ED3AD03